MDLQVSYTTALVLQAIGAGFKYGFDIMDATRLPSGTVYPALRRLEQQNLIKSSWEAEQHAHDDQRPARKYYRLTTDGRKVLHNALQRYALLERLGTAAKSKNE
jgi:PadR family transcriptional regulator